MDGDDLQKMTDQLTAMELILGAGARYTCREVYTITQAFLDIPSNTTPDTLSQDDYLPLLSHPSENGLSAITIYSLSFSRLSWHNFKDPSSGITPSPRSQPSKNLELFDIQCTEAQFFSIVDSLPSEMRLFWTRSIRIDEYEAHAGEFDPSYDSPDKIQGRRTWPPSKYDEEISQRHSSSGESSTSTSPSLCSTRACLEWWTATLNRLRPHAQSRHSKSGLRLIQMPLPTGSFFSGAVPGNGLPLTKHCVARRPSSKGSNCRCAPENSRHVQIVRRFDEEKSEKKSLRNGREADWKPKGSGPTPKQGRNLPPANNLSPSISIFILEILHLLFHSSVFEMARTMSRTFQQRYESFLGMVSHFGVLSGEKTLGVGQWVAMLQGGWYEQSLETKILMTIVRLIRDDADVPERNLYGYMRTKFTVLYHEIPAGISKYAVQKEGR
ncbi:hypothetical protein EV421DRAFT_1738422 [Armillaria borealis]|uniref:Uncharacterized protein n=1 Tax=Armillaria borealis TaxID=47425 RepID=A0AA39JB09_9AGAR|nr:hypothetical protein EV421DRAFT_1738422 [Armillaria borealis]